MKNKSKIVVIIVFLLTAALGATAVFVGYRLQQEEEVTPEEPEAVTIEEYDFFFWCNYVTDSACGSLHTTYYSGYKSSTLKSPCSVIQMDEEGSWPLVYYWGADPQRQWKRNGENDGCAPGYEGCNDNNWDIKNKFDYSSCGSCKTISIENYSEDSVKIKARSRSIMPDLYNEKSQGGSGQKLTKLRQARSKMDFRFHLRNNSGNDVVDPVIISKTDPRISCSKVANPTSTLEWGDDGNPKWVNYNPHDKVYECEVTYTFSNLNLQPGNTYRVIVNSRLGEGFYWRHPDLSITKPNIPYEVGGQPGNGMKYRELYNSNITENPWGQLYKWTENPDNTCVRNFTVDEPPEEDVVECLSMTSPQDSDNNGVVQVDQRADSVTVSTAGSDSDQTPRKLQICYAIAGQTSSYYEDGDNFYCEIVENSNDGTFSIDGSYETYANNVPNNNNLNIDDSGITFAANIWDETAQTHFCSSNPAYVQNSQGVLYGDDCSSNPLSCEKCDLGTNDCQLIIRLAATQEECDCSSLTGPTGDPAPGSVVSFQANFTNNDGDPCDVSDSDITWTATGDPALEEGERGPTTSPGDPGPTHWISYTVPDAAADSTEYCVSAQLANGDDPGQTGCSYCFNVGDDEDPAFVAVKTSQVECIENNAAARITYIIHVRNVSDVAGTIEYVEDTYDSRFDSSWVSNIDPEADSHSGNVIRWDNADQGYNLAANDSQQGGNDEVEFTYQVRVPSEYFGDYENGELVPYEYVNNAIVKPQGFEAIDLSTLVEIECASSGGGSTPIDGDLPSTGVFDNSMTSGLVALLFIVFGGILVRSQSFSYKYFGPLDGKIKRFGSGVKSKISNLKEYLYEETHLTRNQRFERRSVKKTEDEQLTDDN